MHSHNRNPHILMLLENNPYPFDVRVRQEAQACIGASYRVSVISPSRQGQPWREIIDGVSVYRYPGPREGHSAIAFLWEYGYSLLAMFILSLFIWLRDDFDVVHAHNPPDIMCLIGIWYKLWGKYFVFDHHDLSPEIWIVRSGEQNSLLYKILRLFEMISYRVSDRIIVTNESYRNIGRERNIIDDTKIVTVRNGPDIHHFHQVEPDALLQATGRPIVAYVGLIGPQDGVDYLLRAMKILRDEYQRKDVLCLIIGDGEVLPDLKRLCCELNLNEQVQFTGPLYGKALMVHLSSASICVDPDPSNPLNDVSTMVKIVEYMALGKPIVAFDLLEHRASAGDAACYVQPNDERAFAMAISALLDDPHRQWRMGQIGLQRVQERFAWHYCAARLISMYDDLIPVSDHQDSSITI